MRAIKKADVLENVCYDIRGPVLQEATQLEDEGYRIFKLNIGNTAPFGFDVPDEIVHDVVANIRNAQGYVDSRGILPARRAIVQLMKEKGVTGIDVDDVYIGNGVSELIKVTMEGLLNNGDEVLLPMPDYPLWTASVNLARGKAVHYLCDEASDWQPDLQDIRAKISPKTKALVVINPNNPTGAVYSKEIVEGMVAIAEEFGLVLLCDEIYDKILYDGAIHHPPALITDKILVITFGGISKNYRAPGFRCGWMILSGNRGIASEYIEGINILTSMRLCANVPAQFAVQAALGGPQSINELIQPGGRLYRQRDLAWELLNAIPGISCNKPRGALYLFPKIDIKRFNVTDDVEFILGLLREERVLVVQGTGFNWHAADHFRMVFLPPEEDLRAALAGLASYLERRQTSG